MESDPFVHLNNRNTTYYRKGISPIYLYCCMSDYYVSSQNKTLNFKPETYIIKKDKK